MRAAKAPSRMRCAATTPPRPKIGNVEAAEPAGAAPDADQAEGDDEAGGDDGGGEEADDEPAAGKAQTVERPGEGDADEQREDGRERRLQRRDVDADSRDRHARVPVAARPARRRGSTRTALRSAPRRRAATAAPATRRSGRSRQRRGQRIAARASSIQADLLAAMVAGSSDEHLGRRRREAIGRRAGQRDTSSWSRGSPPARRASRASCRNCLARSWCGEDFRMPAISICG